MVTQIKSGHYKFFNTGYYFFYKKLRIVLLRIFQNLKKVCLLELE